MSWPNSLPLALVNHGFLIIPIHLIGFTFLSSPSVAGVWWHGGNQPVALHRCNGSPGWFDSGLQVICIVGSGISHHLLDNTPYILYGVQVRWVFLANQAHGHWTSFWYLWQCGQVPSPAGKWNQHLHKACQQKEASSALKFPGRWLR